MKLTSLLADGNTVSIIVTSENPAEMALIELLHNCTGMATRVDPPTDIEPEPTSLKMSFVVKRGY